MVHHPRFKGGVGKRKPLLINLLDNALGQTSSNSQIEEVFSKLYSVGSKASVIDFAEFYNAALNKRTLTPSEEPSDSDRDKASLGKELADGLRQRVLLPERNHPKYMSKYTQARHNEFAYLREYFSTKEVMDGRSS